jgi:histidine racemase
MQIDFFKLNPGGNPTLLIDNTRNSIRSDDYAGISNLLMKEPFLGSEQVGFIEKPRNPTSDTRLGMMGGEFCINGLRSLGALFANVKTSLSVETSGTEQIVSVETRSVENTLHSKVIFDSAEAITQLRTNLWMVELPGITHFVEVLNDAPKNDSSKATLDILLSDTVKKSYSSSGAYGYIPCTALGKQTYQIWPLVYVVATCSHVFETACGSGSVATHLALSELAIETCSTIRQPSGSDFFVSKNGKSVTLSGPVEYVAHGKVLFDKSRLQHLNPNNLLGTRE